MLQVWGLLENVEAGLVANIEAVEAVQACSEAGQRVEAVWRET